HPAGPLPRRLRHALPAPGDRRRRHAVHRPDRPAAAPGRQPPAGAGADRVARQQGEQGPSVPTDAPLIEPYVRALPGSEASLRPVAAEPDDDTHRLVLADWLEEHGEAERAEFIRLQCRLADVPDWLAWMLPDDPLRRALQLQVAHRKRWAKGVAWADFARG